MQTKTDTELQESAALRQAILRLANDAGPVSEQLADRIVREVAAFRWRGEARRELEARTIKHCSEWARSQESKPMKRCKHRPVESKATFGPYKGPLYGRLNSVARCGKTRTDFCRCGAKRFTNLNHGHQEFGRWHEQLELQLSLSEEKEKPQQTDGPTSHPKMKAKIRLEKHLNQLRVV